MRNIAILSDLLPLILFIFFAKSKKNIGLRVVFFLAIYSIIVNFFILSNRQLWQYSFLIGRIATIVEFSLFSIFFFRVIESRTFKKGMVAISILMAAYLIYSLITFSNNSFDSVPSGITAMVFFIYCIFYLFERVRDPTSLFLYSSPAFWIVVAIIIYSAGTFFPFIYAQDYINKSGFNQEYTLIHSTLYILKNLLFSAAMLISDKTIKSSYPMNKKK